MSRLRQVFKFSFQLCDVLNKTPFQLYHRSSRYLRKLSINKEIARNFSTEFNAVTNEEENKETKPPLGKVEGRLMIQFTCKKCGVRNSKTMSKLAYEKGVVIIRCDGCKNNHLIADNLGWLGVDRTKRNIEKLMKLNGETVKRLNRYGDSVTEFLTKEEPVEAKNSDDENQKDNV